MLEPHHYLTKNPGKNFRKNLMKALNLWLQVPEERLLIISNAIYMLHNASLMIDDIQDDSKMRRGVPATHLLYGMPKTISTALYLCGLALEEIRKLNNPEALKIYSEEFSKFQLGQGIELHWRDNVICPTEQEYIDIVVDGKTTALLRMLVRLMQAESRSSIDCTNLINKFGKLGQITNDFLGFESAQWIEEKGCFCEDVSEGKFSLPIIHFMTHQSDLVTEQDRLRFMEILRLRTTNHDILMEALDLLKRAKSLDYCRDLLIDLDREIVQEIRALGGNPMIEHILDKFRFTNKYVLLYRN
ncbi:geranylgeranyl pyrophosphate synthase [Phascolomyces articulosus]|uniref:Geranylgeranyl pyrophosphate synthase n=1 Tax=Phascolomyces articulosus TaxID=60185 RepID=A0AAD5PA80_9FUNG|nr:geranylgeranyl pyrophosphate synthase [Phascolomyces articulosus]